MSTSSDVFSNPSNDYIYPGLSPCPGIADDQYLTWADDGLAIIKGSDVVALLSFSDLGIPVASFNKQQITLGAGEVSFIAGLTKGLCNRNQGFTMPSLVSTSISLNPYFMQIDLSINYYKNFSYTYSNIDVSADYGQNISVEDALNLALDSAGIRVANTYDPSVLSFTGTQEGYEFNVSNVLLTIIDVSENSNSPFAHLANAETYLLTEDSSVNIPFAKYPNTAMQGIALKGIYPYDYSSITLCEEDKWIYLNHVSDYITVYDPISVNYYKDASSALSIQFDSSTILGCGISEPLTYDVSFLTLVSPLLYTDLFLSGVIIDDSSIIDCSIGDSSISNSNMETDNYVTSSVIYNSYIEDSSVYYSTIENYSRTNNTEIGQSIVNFITSYKTFFEECSIGDSSISGGSIINSSTITNTLIENSWVNATLDASIGTSAISNCEIWDSSINNAIIEDCSIFRTYLEDVSLNECTIYNSIMDPSFYVSLADNNRIIMIDPSISNEIDINLDTSTFYLKHRNRLEVGMSGCSVDDVMSAGDYLNMVTVNGMWKKVGEMYIWTSGPDADCTTANLIDGFYVYNPHEFPVKIEYIVFV